MKIIVFDFDGTLGDSRSLIIATMQQTLKKLGLPSRSDDECAAMIGLPLRETFTRLVPMSEDTGKLCEETYNELFKINNRPGIVKPFPGVIDTIKELYAQGFTLTIASSRGRDSLVEYVKEMGLSKYISFIVSAWDVKHAKPYPDMIHHILNHTDATPSQVLVVGDTRYDIEMGRNAGTKTCGVTYGNGSREELCEADFVISRFSKLLDVI